MRTEFGQSQFKLQLGEAMTGKTERGYILFQMGENWSKKWGFDENATRTQWVLRNDMTMRRWAEILRVKMGNVRKTDSAFLINANIDEESKDERFCWTWKILYFPDFDWLW